MADQKSVKSISVDCFGVRSDSRHSEPVDLTDSKMPRLKAVFNPELGQYDFVDDEPLDLDEVIMSYKDDCGTELVKRMIKRGEDLSQFADDGQHSADLSGLSFEVVESKRQLAKQQDVLKKIAEALGVELKNDSSLDETITNAVKAKYELNNSEVKKDEQ